MALAGRPFEHPRDVEAFKPNVLSPLDLALDELDDALPMINSGKCCVSVTCRARTPELV